MCLFRFFLSVFLRELGIVDNADYRKVDGCVLQAGDGSYRTALRKKHRVAFATSNRIRRDEHFALLTCASGQPFDEH